MNVSIAERRTNWRLHSVLGLQETGGETQMEKTDLSALTKVGVRRRDKMVAKPINESQDWAPKQTD